MKDNIQLYSKTFYSKKVLTKAISDYHRIATIKLSENGSHYMCEFRKCVVDEQTVMNEFNNYLIELLNSSGDSVDL